MTTSLDRTPLPLWVRVLDVATIAVGGLGLLLAITGGSRFTVLGLRISLTSGVRPLVLATALALIRHAIVRRDPLNHRVAQWLRTVPRTVFFLRIWPTFVATRLAILLVGYFAVAAVGFQANKEIPFRASYDELWNLVARWDAGWYYNIAAYGYSFQPGAHTQQNVAFFPAYPMLMRYVGRFLGNQAMAAGLLVSLGAFLLALVYLYRLARQHLDEDHAVQAIVLVACYPFAYFFGAVYAESLFLLGAVAAFYHLGRRELVRAAAWGLLVGLTRPNGFLLSVPLAIVALEPLLAAKTPARLRWWWTGRSSPTVEPAVVSSRALVQRLVVAGMPTAGMLLFSAYLFHLTNDPFAWRTAHAAWGRTYQGVTGVVGGTYRYFFEYGMMAAIKAAPYDTINAMATVFALSLVWPVTRRFGLAYGLFVAINVAAPLLSGGVLAMGRFTSVLFPLFFWLGDRIPERHRVLWVGVFGMGQAFSATLFFTWRDMY